MISFACISPHAPILLPTVGSAKDRSRVNRTISSLEKLKKQLAKTNPDIIIVSSPHPDWGVHVPLHFLVKSSKFKIQNYLSADSPFENWRLKIVNY